MRRSVRPSGTARPRRRRPTTTASSTRGAISSRGTRRRRRSGRSVRSSRSRSIARSSKPSSGSSGRVTGSPPVTIGATRAKDAKPSKREIGPRLTTDDAATLTSFAQALVGTAFLERAAKEATRKALVATSAATIVGVKGGNVVVQVEPGKHSTPIFRADNPREVESIEICYQHKPEEPTAGGAVRGRWMWFRRTIDAKRDVTFKEVPVVGGVHPKWEEDPEKTVEHGFGFCPVRWWRTLPDSCDPLDGTPVLDPVLYAVFEAVDYTISQRDRAVSYGMDPQLVRRGLNQLNADNLVKSPDGAWDIPENADAQFLEVSGAGTQRGTEHADDLTARDPGRRAASFRSIRSSSRATCRAGSSNSCTHR
jgi:hypothetical protein